MSNAQPILPPEITPEAKGFDDAPRKPFKIPRALKWFAGTAIGFVLLAGGAGLVATQVLDQQKYKTLVVDKIKEASGYTVDWEGNIQLGLMPLPHAAVYNLSVKAGAYPVLTLDKADVQVSLSALLNKKIDVRNVTLDNPVVTLTTARNGTQTWIADKSETASPSVTDASSDSAVKSDFEVVVNRVDITNGKVIIDNQKDLSKQELNNLNVALRAESLKGPFDVTASTEWSGQSVELKATSGVLEMFGGAFPLQATLSLPSSGAELGFAGTLDPKASAVIGDITVKADNIADAIKNMTGSAPSLPKGLGGQLMLAGKLDASSSAVALNDMTFGLGALHYTGAFSAEGLGGKQSPQLTFRLDPKGQAHDGAEPLVNLLSDMAIFAKGAIEDKKITLTLAEIKTKGTDVSLSGYSTMGANPTVDLAIKAGAINLDALQNKLSGEKSDTAVDSSSGASSAGAGIKGFSVPFEGRVRANIGSLTTGGKTYSGITADVVSHQGALTIANAAVSLPENAVVGVSGKIAKTADLSGLDLKLSARTNDTEKLMAAYGVTPPNLPKKIGAASVDAHVTGDTQNLGFSAATSALQFRLSGEGIVQNPLNTPSINALKFTVRHPNFNEAMQTFQPGFNGSSGFYGVLDMSGQVAWEGDTYSITGLSGKLGQTSVAGKISATTKPKMTVTGDLDIGAIVLPSATTGGGESAAAASSSASGDRWSRETIDTAWMQSFNADLKVRAKSITQNMWKLTDANFAFQLNNGVLTLDDISAGLFGGRAAINGVMKSGGGAQDPVSLSGTLSANNVDAQSLMSAATGKSSHTLTGTLSDVTVSINATGASPYALVQTLGGKGSVNGKNIIVKGIDAAQLADAARGSYKPLERAGSLFQSFQSGQTEFSTFNSDFVIQSGVVNFSKILFDGDKATLSSTGNANLPAWTIDLKNTMTVKNTDIPPFDFSIRGPLDNPINSGGDIVNNYLKKKFEKKAVEFLEKKLDGKLGEKLGKVNEMLGGTGLGIPLLNGLGVKQQQQPAAQPAVTPQDATAPTDITPEVAPTPAPVSQPDTPQAADTNVDTNKEAAKEAVKALEGLLGQ